MPPLRPDLVTDRLRLRPWTTADRTTLHRMWTDPDVRRFLWDDQIIGRQRADSTVALGLDAAREPGLGFWIIEPREREAAIGFVGLWRRGEPGMDDPELLYGLLPAWWGRGFATEAAARVLQYAREVGGFARVIAATDPPNTASIRVMERIGMRYQRTGMLEERETVFYVLEAEAGGREPA
jgi:ribosomal-protein-alanine N-acetyltransferase